MESNGAAASRREARKYESESKGAYCLTKRVGRVNAGGTLRAVRSFVLALAIGVLSVSSCGGTQKKPPAERARRAATFSQTGMASWYGPGFAGRPTASGEKFDPDDMTCAHPKLKFGTRVSVTNLENGKRVVVRVNDRGPFAKGRVIDLSKEAAKRLGFLEKGVAKVRVEVLPAVATSP